MPIDYERGKIYKIVCNETGKLYVGSTCEPTLAHRLAKHISSYKRFLKVTYPYYTSYDVIENGNYFIELLENCPCKTKDELFVRERYYIELLDCVNKCIPGHSRHEYNKKYEIKNKEKIKKYKQEYNKEFKFTHKEHIKEYQHIYKNVKQRELKEYYQQYAKTHVDKLNENKKKYALKNMEKIKENLSQNYICFCGKQCKVGSKLRHIQSNHHNHCVQKIKNLFKLYKSLLPEIEKVVLDVKKFNNTNHF